MAAIDSFDAYLKLLNEIMDENLKEEIKNHRLYILELRNEDEQQRYLEEFIKWIYLVRKEGIKKK